MKDRLARVLTDLSPCLLAISGGLDSLTLAALAARVLGADFAAVHAVGPAVPQAATVRLQRLAAAEGFRLHLVDAGETRDPDYLANPAHRCYHCKSRLFAVMRRQADDMAAALGRPVAMISGTNTDDLGDFRPGLKAAAEHGVRHPYVEAGMSKDDVRALARQLGLPFADIPASPCLASRIYTGTPVTAQTLRAVDFAEEFVRAATGLAVVRCRVRQGEMLVEARNPAELPLSLAADLDAALRERGHTFNRVSLDPAAYAPGRAFDKSS